MSCDGRGCSEMPCTKQCCENGSCIITSQSARTATVATLGKGMKSRNNQEEIKVGSETTVN